MQGIVCGLEGNRVNFCRGLYIQCDNDYIMMGICVAKRTINSGVFPKGYVIHKVTGPMENESALSLNQGKVEKVRALLRLSIENVFENGQVCKCVEDYKHTLPCGTLLTLYSRMWCKGVLYSYCRSF